MKSIKTLGTPENNFIQKFKSKRPLERLRPREALRGGKCETYSNRLYIFTSILNKPTSG